MNQYFSHTPFNYSSRPFSYLPRFDSSFGTDVPTIIEVRQMSTPTVSASTASSMCSFNTKFLFIMGLGIVFLMFAAFANLFLEWRKESAEELSQTNKELIRLKNRVNETLRVVIETSVEHHEPPIDEGEEGDDESSEMSGSERSEHSSRSKASSTKCNCKCNDKDICELSQCFQTPKEKSEVIV